MCGEEFEGGHLEHDRMEEEVPRRRPLVRVRLQARSDEVLLLLILQTLDGVVDVVLGHLAE